MINKLSFLLISFVCLFLSALPVLAQDSSPVSRMVTEEIDISNTANYKVSGNIKVNNNSDRGLDNYFLIIKLSEPGKATAKDGKTKIAESLTVEYLKTGPFSLSPGQSESREFGLKYPATIKPGNYLLTAEIVGQDTSSIAIGSSEVSLLGSGDFLEVDPASCKVKVRGILYGFFEGPNVGESENAEASCIVKNTTGKNINGRMQFLYAVNSVPRNPDSLSQIETQPLTVFPPGQEKIISFNLPSSLLPQVYEGMFRLSDGSGQKISVNIPFRWIITGPSSTITNILLERSYYKSGQTAKVTVGILPSADLSWRGNKAPFTPGAGTDLINPKVALKILNKGGEVCGEITEKLSSSEESWTGLSYEIPILRDCQDPRIEVSVAAENSPQPLVKMNIAITSTQSDIKLANSQTLVGKKITNKTFGWFWILIGFIVIALIAAGLYFWKFRRKNPPDQPKSGTGSSLPTSAVTAAALMIMAATGLLLKNPDLFTPPAVRAGQDIVKSPVNSSDAMTKNMVMKDQYDGRTDIWGNVRDFKQNNGAGDSDITILPNCDKMNITVRGTAGSGWTCSNWGPGLIVFPFIDSQGMTVENPVSSIGNEVFSPLPGDLFTQKDHVNVVQFNQGNGQREVSFSVTPTADQKVGKHSLYLKVGLSHMVRHSAVEHVSTSFQDKPQCDGNGRCYVLLKYDFICREPLACNAPCADKDECFGNKEGCTECRSNDQGQKVCQPPPACNASCSTQEDCKSNQIGCTDCRPDTTGKNVCQKPPLACNAACAEDKDCFGNREGCNMCLEGACRKPPACNDRCTTDKTCETAKDGCTACVNGSCRIPPACGTACQTRADCQGAKDGCSGCELGTCTNYTDQMCKCDGMVADITYPSNAFNFEAFGKVEGPDIKKAEIADVTFRMTKDNQVVAKSNPITPSIVENTATKVRFKAAWSTPPPPISKDSTYRVFADVRCKPKRVTTAQNFTPAAEKTIMALQKQSLPPKGLKFIAESLDKLLGNNWLGRPLVGEVLAQLSSPSPSPSVAQTNLQLQTLNFVKLMDTDNCRFVMFKFDEALF